MKAAHSCTHPAHHVDDAAAFLQAVKVVCAQRGLRLTPIRSRVLGLIAKAGGPVKAYDLLNQMRDDEGVGSSAPPTVYRVLDFLLSNGFIHKLESINAFIACHHPSAAQHSVPFLICDNCHETVELEDESISQSLESRAQMVGFHVHAQVLEVHGLCARCQQKPADREAQQR